MESSGLQVSSVPSAPLWDFAVRAWNLGGVDEIAAPEALRDLGVPGTDNTIYLLQEVPRREAGWHSETMQGWTAVSFRHEEVWRGTGLLYKDSCWKIVRKLSSGRGTWYRVRHVAFASEFWVGTAHFDPGCTQGVHRAAVEEHLSKLKPTVLPVVLACDINSPIRWELTEDGDSRPFGRDGKTVGFLDVIASRGFRLAAPLPSQFETPTSRPRQEGRSGKQIDCVCIKGLPMSKLVIHEDSHKSLGTDHELLQVEIQLRTTGKRRTHCTRPRVWTGGPGIIEHIDEEVLKTLARTCTKPKPGACYRDPPEVRAAAQRARASKTREGWKTVQNMRKQARREWESKRIQQATQGDWAQVRKLRSQRNTGWDTHYAEQQPEGEAHDSIHNHLSNIYQTGQTLPELGPWTGEAQAFTEDELRAALAAGGKGKAVGVDLTSHELLQGICDTPGGFSHLLEFFNKVFCTAEVPSDWNRALMLVIPKVSLPTEPGDLRPLAMGSAAAKVFARMLLARTEPKIRIQGPEQCSGKGRQCCDFVFTVARLVQLEQEWKRGICWLKVDLSKAFDRVDRKVLTGRLLEKLGMCPEYRCWYNLLRNTDAVLQTDWDSTIINMQGGIKQGAIESPAFFSFLAETCLHEASQRYEWHKEPNAFEGLDLNNLLYMDDGLMWSKGMKGIEARVAQWGAVLQEFGLRINAKKCQLYVSPYHTGKRTIRVQGEVLHAAEDLKILGLTYRVGATSSEMIAPLLAKARAKFWGGLKHLLRAKTPIGGRMLLMERVLGGTVLWPLAALPMDSASLGLVNSLQLQMTIWIMRVAKRPDEGWVQFRERAYRDARAVVYKYSKRRWSTLWLERWWNYAGHRTRCSMHETQNAATVVDTYRTRVWWRQQQSNPAGVKHSGHIYPKLMNMERDMDRVTSGPWRERAYDRQSWKGFLTAWIAQKDLPWASLRQLSISDEVP